METRVKDLMTPDVATIRCDQDVHELETLLVSRAVHGVPVVDDQRRIVGVVSQSDMLAWHCEARIADVAFYDPPPSRPAGADRPATPRIAGGRTATVAEVMSPVVHCIAPEASLAEAAGRMVREHIHRLIVVNDDFTVVGILSATDLLQSVPGADRFIGDPR